jgi:hypothetical protein
MPRLLEEGMSLIRLLYRMGFAGLVLLGLLIE